MRGAGVGVFRQDFKGFCEGLGAEVGDSIVELICGFVREDGDFAAGDDVACVELANYVNDADSCFLVTVGDGALDAGGAAIFWQQGGVEVDDAFGWGVPDSFADDLSVGHDYCVLDVEFGEGFGNFFDFVWLPDRD